MSMVMEPVVYPDRVRAAMDAKGWDQVELALQSGVNQSSVSRLLSSGTGHAVTIKKVAGALGVSTDYLYGLSTGDKELVLSPELRAELANVDREGQMLLARFARFYKSDPSFPAVDDRQVACV